MRKIALALMVVGGLVVGAAHTATAADDYHHGYWYGGHGYRYGGHSRFHDDLEHRDFHRDLYHRDAHRYPMTWRQHGRLHDDLEHDAYHDRLEHRQYHRSYSPYYYGRGIGIGGRGFYLYFGR